MIEEQTQNQEAVGEPQQNQQQPQQSSQTISQAPVVENGFKQASMESLAGDTVNTSPQQVPTSGILQTQPASSQTPQIQALPNTPLSSINSSPALGVGQAQTQAQKQDTTQPTTVPRPESTSIPPQDLEPQKKSKLWIILVILFVVIATVGGGLYYFRTKAVEEVAKEDKTNASLNPTPSQTPVVIESSPASESATVKIDLSKYKIQVLNGSGVKGEASKVKDILEKEQFVVQDIDNADSPNYEKTIVRAKKDVQKEYLDTLKKLLGKTYILDLEEDLEESASVDVIVIIGSSKKP